MPSKPYFSPGVAVVLTIALLLAAMSPGLGQTSPVTQRSFSSHHFNSSTSLLFAFEEDSDEDYLQESYWFVIENDFKQSNIDVAPEPLTTSPAGSFVLSHFLFNEISAQAP
jgi:hypothetical protein